VIVAFDFVVGVGVADAQPATRIAKPAAGVPHRALVVTIDTVAPLLPNVELVDSRNVEEVHARPPSLTERSVSFSGIMNTPRWSVNPPAG
jgi:hypothetical protein